MLVHRAKKGAVPNPEFKIRRASEADLDDLAEQRNSMYRDMFPDSTLDYVGYKKR